MKRTYNKFRNSVNQDIKASRIKYYSTYFEKCKNNMKDTWKGINQLVSTKLNAGSKINQIKTNNDIIDDPKMISNTFNNYFVNVGPNTDKDIPFSTLCPSFYLKQRVERSFEILPTTNAEVMTLILQLDDSKSSGPSSIPTKILKIAAPKIVPIFVKIVNSSLMTGIFPSGMKLAKVIPIFKNGNIQDVNNYRPILLLSVFSKIIEKLMHKRLYSFLESHKVI